MSGHRSHSIPGASLWMLFVFVLLIWAPFVGPLVGGVVGGRHAGSVGRAIASVGLAVLLAGAIALCFGALISSWPIFGALASLGASMVVAAHLCPLLLGGIIGGLFPLR